MKLSKTTLALAVIITLIPCLIGVFLWGRLPERIPTHFNFSGEINGYSSKGSFVIGMPVLMAAVEFLMYFFIANDPKRKNMSRKLIAITFWIIPVLTVFMMMLCYGIALGMGIDIGMAVNLFLGIFLVIIGNYLPKTRQNYSMGIKLPWTLSSEENWNRTHRMAGWLWVAGGVLFMVNAFFKSPVLMILALILMSGVPAGYSFWLYRHGI